MMISALFGALFSYWAQSWAVGVLAAVAFGALVAFLIGFFALKLKTDIILAGIAVNMIGDGGTQFFLYLFTGMSGSTSGLTTSKMLIPTVRIPLIADIPVVGEILSGHSVLTYAAFLMVLVLWVILQKTPLGLNIRAVGENPNAASSVGLSVTKYKYIALMLGGALAGLGGAFMSMYYSQSWNVNMVAGRGFIALAAEAMGNHTPLGAMLSSLLFGLAQAVSIKVAGLGLSSDIVSAIPVRDHHYRPCGVRRRAHSQREESAPQAERINQKKEKGERKSCLLLLKKCCWTPRRAGTPSARSTRKTLKWRRRSSPRRRSCARPS